MPDTADAYTHRIGRTGRALQTGEAFTLAVPSDEPMVREVEKVLKTRIERRRLPGFGYGTFNPEAQFPQRPPSRPQQNGARPGGNASKVIPGPGEVTRWKGPAVRKPSGRPGVARKTRPGLGRR